MRKKNVAGSFFLFQVKYSIWQYRQSDGELLRIEGKYEVLLTGIDFTFKPKFLKPLTIKKFSCHDNGLATGKKWLNEHSLRSAINIPLNTVSSCHNCGLTWCSLVVLCLSFTIFVVIISVLYQITSFSFLLSLCNSAFDLLSFSVLVQATRKSFTELYQAIHKIIY